MGNKSLRPIPIITNGDMSQASLTSIVVPIQFEDNVGMQFVWTGSPVGTFTVQVSLDQINWSTIPPTSFSGTYPIPGTTSSPGYLDMALLSAAFVRVIYTKSSGSGTLNVLCVAKSV